MDQFWRAIVTEIAWQLVGPIVSAAVAALMGWLVFWWQKLFKSNFDEKARATIHSALERGVLYTIQKIRDQHGFVSPTQHRSLIQQGAAEYAEKWSGGTIKAKKLSHGDLMELAVPHLPLPAGLILPGKVKSETLTP